MIEEKRRFRRKVEPFTDIEVDVDLQDVLTQGPGLSAAPYVDVYPLADWIEDGWVTLRVVAPHHFILLRLGTELHQRRARAAQ